jgi:hypothetical protein
MFIAEPLDCKKSEPFSLTHRKANKGKKHDEKFYTAFEKA